ncbi:DUF4350 domain-containing protein [Sphingomonas sp.]|uniref:DUF4350 domain-containing protein n=1 Tax=Sphingomonas sp. TaxID=28214 RepID=UPI0025FD9078|nr:DUF4350 domain-containing protein [Sphingomonas sp.]
MLTSLPLVFNEQMSLDGGGSSALTRLEQRYRVETISVADAASLKGPRLLLMAQPRAQPAEALVELDRWVRDGGHLLLLADPKLEWPSQRPLGDKLRPPPMFADTGLLNHWGLTLSESGLVSSGSCEVADPGLVARCRIGKGSATVVADADFINVEDPDAPGLDLMMSELSRLGTR